MANIKSAAKRARQSEKRRRHNAALRTRVRSAVKKSVKANASGNAGQATAAYRSAVPEIDTMVSKGIIHRNKAARHKSRLNRTLKALKAK